MLSCGCDNEHEWYYIPPDDFIEFDAIRRKRCASCGELINFVTDCLKFDCYRYPYNDIEEKIYGDEVPMAYRYMCEPCGEIFLNLNDLSYCISLGDDMRENLSDYWDLTGFEPKGNI